MNIWVKSILIGVGVTIVTYLMLYKKSPETYKGHYVIRVKENENAVVDDKRTIERVADNLESKLARSDIKAEIKILNDQLIDIKFSNIKYAYWIPNIINSKIELEFREMYALKDLSGAFSKADTILGFSKSGSPLQKNTIVKDTGGLATFTEGYKPEPPKSQRSLASFIQFAEGYINTDQVMVFPPYIGKVLLKDTAFVDSIFHRKDILKILPPDLKLLYSPLYLDANSNKPNKFLYLYGIHSMKENPAPINNNSIIKAGVEENYNGEATISLEFSVVGAKKWERMTTDNVGKSIGIIINDEVIFAPKVMGPISDGTASINGGYTKQQATYLAGQILAGSIPATITIVRKEVSREKEPFLTGNLTLYLIVFLVAGLVSYLIFNLLDKNKRKPFTRLDL